MGLTGVTDGRVTAWYSGWLMVVSLTKIGNIREENSSKMLMGLKHL